MYTRSAAITSEVGFFLQNWTFLAPQIIQGKTGCENHCFLHWKFDSRAFSHVLWVFGHFFKNHNFLPLSFLCYTLDAPFSTSSRPLLLLSALHRRPQLSAQPRKLSQTPIIATGSGQMSRQPNNNWPFCIWPSSSPKLALKRPSLSKEGRIREQYCVTQWKVGLFLSAIISVRI